MPSSKKSKQEQIDEESEPQGGPINRLQAMLEERLATPHEKSEDDEPDDGAPATPFGIAPEPDDDGSQDDAGVEGPIDGLTPPPDNYRQERMAEYRARQRRELPDSAPPDGMGMAPVAPPNNNWIPIGPSVVLQGQVSNQANVSGRVAGVAIASGGTRVYVASANGGVWRSDDGGTTWADTMQAWDLDPTTASSDSLACGAIAIDPANADRVYVGTGEGDSDWAGGGAISGVGAVVSNDGGTNWNTEPSSPNLAGSSFYQLAVDPDDPDIVVAATVRGIYRREPAGGGGFIWNRTKTGRTFAVVVAKNGSTKRYYATQDSAGVFSSPDGVTWTAVGTGYPTGSTRRAALAVRPSDPTVVYALASRGDNWKMLGVYRLDNATGSSPAWRQVGGAPADLFGTGTFGQGWWDIDIEVDPGNVNRIYLAGSTRDSGAAGADKWSSALYRGSVTSSGSGSGLTYSMSTVAIGADIHADLHRLAITPGDNDNLWVCSDGGLYETSDASSTATFEGRNVGLNTITCEHLSLHPTEGSVALVGGQDHGTMRYVGEEAWLHMAPGDGGYSVINWNDPYKMIVTYPSTVVRRFTDGGTRYNYTHVNLNSNDAVLFYPPMVGTPRNPASPAEAERVAIATNRPWISEVFGGSWASIPNNNTSDRLGSGDGFRIRSMVFASASRLYVGTMNGRVFRYDRSGGGTWSRTRIDDDGGLPSTFAVPVTDIAVDPTDSSDSSIYITFGGMLGDARRVWRYNGSSWSNASGSGANGLLDVQFGAIVCDPDNSGHVYAGADIGVWRSIDSGANWSVFSQGLPDSFVMDMKTVRLQNGLRMLRCSTHGRGVFERTLDTAPKTGVELYVRDTQLDEGRFTTINWLDDPANQGEDVRHWRGPDIKIDTPDAMGDYQFPLGAQINFADFVGTLDDDSRTVATHVTETVVSRVYVQVHNRGVVPADNVRVTCLLANASAGLPNLPAGYDANVRNGMPITTPDWVTLGSVLIDGVAVGNPKVAAFDLPSNLLPPPASLAGNDHHCVLALVHHADDQYTSTEVQTDTNSKQERKAAHKNLKVVEFTGTVPAMMPVRFNCTNGKPTTMRLRLNGYRGKARLYFPRYASPSTINRSSRGFEVAEDFDPAKEWAEPHLHSVFRNFRSNRPFNREFAKQRIENVERMLENDHMLQVTNTEEAELRNIECGDNGYIEFYLLLERPPRSRVGDSFPIEILQLDAESKEVIGGLSARIDITKEPEHLEYKLEVTSGKTRFRGIRLLRAWVQDANGERVDPDRTQIRVSSGTQELEEMRWHRSWRSYFVYLRAREGAQVNLEALVDGRSIGTVRHRL